METNIRCISLMTHPCRVPLHSISRKIINRTKSAELAGGAGSGKPGGLTGKDACVCVCVFVCVCVLTLHKGMIAKTDLVTLRLSVSLSLETLSKNKHGGIKSAKQRDFPDE